MVAYGFLGEASALCNQNVSVLFYVAKVLVFEPVSVAVLSVCTSFGP